MENAVVQNQLKFQLVIQLSALNARIILPIPMYQLSMELTALAKVKRLSGVVKLKHVHALIPQIKYMLFPQLLVALPVMQL